jgi:hypothetical protein
MLERTTQEALYSSESIVSQRELFRGLRFDCDVIEPMLHSARGDVTEPGACGARFQVNIPDVFTISIGARFPLVLSNSRSMAIDMNSTTESTGAATRRFLLVFPQKSHFLPSAADSTASAMSSSSMQSAQT